MKTHLASLALTTNNTAYLTHLLAAGRLDEVMRPSIEVSVIFILFPYLHYFPSPSPSSPSLSLPPLSLHHLESHACREEKG